jgi:hypothetical protein
MTIGAAIAIKLAAHPMTEDYDAVLAGLSANQ